MQSLALPQNFVILSDDPERSEGEESKDLRLLFVISISDSIKTSRAVLTRRAPHPRDAFVFVARLGQRVPQPTGSSGP